MDSREKRKLPAGEDQAPSPSPKRRVLGPSLPPPELESQASAGSDNGSDESDESDDDFGPSLPPPEGQSIASAVPAAPSTHQSSTPAEDEKPESRRDQWMLHPPEQSDWASKIDPTQLRNRKFQTGKSARSATGSSKTVDASWVETPEERMRRLEDQVMGVGAPSSGSTQHTSRKTDAAKDKSMEEKIKKFNVSRAARNPT